MESESKAVVLYPSPGMGHLISMVELGKLILNHYPCSFSSVTILITTPPFNTGSTASYLDSLLPEGFLDRTKERGFIVKSWVPQVAVLSHESVGGFVTHCGWNSVLEAVSAGVPMVAWPLYAEQKFNRVVLVEELKLALALDELEGEGGFVTAAELEKRVRELMMNSEEGNSVREIVKAKKEEAKMAMSEGGTSRAALAKLVHSI